MKGRYIIGIFSLIVMALWFQNCGQPGELELSSESTLTQLSPTINGCPVHVVCDDSTPPPPVVTFPNAQNIATITFEDNYPNPGDADYEDFVANISVEEFVNSRGEIYQIVVDFVPRARGAGYDHALLMVLDGQKDNPTDGRLARLTSPLFAGNGSIRLIHYNQNGQAISEQSHLNKNQDIVVFSSTKAIFGQDNANVSTSNCTSVAPSLTARLIIDLAQPELNPLGNRRSVDISKYRIVLHVKDTNKSIDLVDVNTGMIDDNGMPYGFFVPTNWKWPGNGNNIHPIYPYFNHYANYLLVRQSSPNVAVSQQALQWYNYVDPQHQNQLANCK